MKVREVRINELHAAPWNPRQIAKSEMAKLKRSRPPGPGEPARRSDRGTVRSRRCRSRRGARKASPPVPPPPARPAASPPAGRTQYPLQDLELLEALSGAVRGAGHRIVRHVY